jgi:transposase-like protein
LKRRVASANPARRRRALEARADGLGQPAGVSTRRYASTREPVPETHRPSVASKSAVSRRFVQLSQEQLAHWLARSIGELDLPVVMIDGIHFRDRVILLAIGIDAQSNKHVLGVREGSTEATRVGSPRCCRT